MTTEEKAARVLKLKIEPITLIEGTARIVLKDIDGNDLQELEINTIQSDGTIVCLPVQESKRFNFALGS